MTEQIQEPQKLPCPICHSVDSVIFQGRDACTNNRRFFCNICKKTYYKSNGMTVPYSRMPNSVCRIINEAKQPCPECGKIDDVKFNGHKGEKRMFFCKKCKRLFVFPYGQRGKNRICGKTTEHVVDLPFLDCSNLLKRWNRPVPNFDSLVGVPCFGCDDFHLCDATRCEKMERYVRNLE